MKTPAFGGTPAGTVKFVSGEVKAVAPDGSIRILQAGDRVFVSEVVATTANAVVQIHFENGRLFDLEANATLVLADPTLGTSGVSRPMTGFALDDILEGEVDSSPITDPDRLASAEPGNETAENRGSELPSGDHAAVVVDQSNAGIHLTVALPPDTTPENAAALSEDRGPFQEDALFPVRDAGLLQHPGAAARVHGTENANTGDDSDNSTQILADSSGQPAPSTPAPAAADTLAAGDLLDQPQQPGDLAAFLSFGYDAQTHSTTVTVQSAGSSGGEHKIVLLGVDLTAGGTLGSDTVIQNLLASSKLHTDG